MKNFIYVVLMAFLVFSCSVEMIKKNEMSNPDKEYNTISKTSVISLFIDSSRGSIDEEIYDVNQAKLSVESPDGSIQSQTWEKGITSNQFNFIIKKTGIYKIIIVETDTGHNSYTMEKQINIQMFKNYKYRVKLGGNIDIIIDEPILTPTNESFVAPELQIPGETPSSAWFNYKQLTVHQNDVIELKLFLNSGLEKIGAFGFDISFDQTILARDESIGTSSSLGVLAGTAIDPSNIYSNMYGKGSDKVLRIASFDISGIGPGTQLHMATIYLKAINTGTTDIKINIQILVNMNYQNLIKPNNTKNSKIIVL